MNKRTRTSRATSSASTLAQLPKTPTGISGLDEITFGGFPKGRPTLVCGGAGCGKTLLAMEFLVRGVLEFDEPGVFMSFEESESELGENVKSLSFDLAQLERKKKIIVDHVVIEKREIEETGEYDLEGLFVRLGYAIDSIGAKRVVLDTIEALFSGLQNEGILRAELRRVFSFLKAKGVTAIITGEKGEKTLTKQGLEEYVSDCVIFLDHRVNDQLSTRRLRVVKYRGSVHGTNEYPFLIGEQGFSVLPITSMGLNHRASEERVSSGIAELDKMLGKGYFSGSTIMVTGPAGSAKTSFACHFAADHCKKRQKCLYLSFEESPDQTIRNMKSIGINLQKYRDDGSLRICATRPSYYGLEMHLTQTIKLIEEFKPTAVIIDPLTDLTNIGSALEIKLMLARLIDFLKNHGITGLMTGLRSSSDGMERDDEAGISSLIDTWIVLDIVTAAGEKHRTISIAKSRGMAHSNQIREFLLTNDGVSLKGIYQRETGKKT